jgi:hypothetical protein
MNQARAQATQAEDVPLPSARPLSPWVEVNERPLLPSGGADFERLVAL